MSKKKKRAQCWKPKASSACHTSQAIQSVQPLPEAGLLADNSNLVLTLLAKHVRRVQDRAYSYVVRSVRTDRNTLCFRQHGSAPNFQGDVLTLCTCKHQMRSSQSADEWKKNVWIAGFTSRTILEGKHWLFYLAQVKSAHDSQADLWNSMDVESRQAKAAHVHYLGDMFKPKKPKPTGYARYSPTRYYAPSIHSHRRNRSDNGWHKDIDYRHRGSLRRPPLLVADPELTFLWDEPIIFLDQNHCRDYFKWSSLQHLIAQLRNAT